jgi:predicted CxxxxCH...CXXCH cytochrome family protein
VNGETLESARGVGAHQKHLATGTVGKTVKCQECHVIPGQVFSPGHLDSPLPAEVSFNDTLARLVTGGGKLTPNPSYDPATVKCSNTYCHGNWQARKSVAPSQFQYAYVDSVIVGNNVAPSWTGGSASAACGSCHDLPPKGHVGFGSLDVTTCGNSGCHPGVVDDAGNIMDKNKHMNGKINVFGNELNF